MPNTQRQSCSHLYVRIDRAEVAMPESIGPGPSQTSIVVAERGWQALQRTGRREAYHPRIGVRIRKI